MVPQTKTETIVLGGGCFWCMEAVFDRTDGVVSAVSGYAGGTVDKPTYEQVCSGASGHAEVVKIDFDPRKINYEQVLDVFFNAHDPTTENRQGADVGTQYRSIILYVNESQKNAAERKIKELNSAGIFERRIVTQVVPLHLFWEAEEYHQDYYDSHPFAGYCRVVIAPKLKKIGLSSEALVK